MSNQDPSGLERVRVSKKELLKKIKQNREEHHDSFDKAFKGYKEQLILRLSQLLDDAKSGLRVDHYIHLDIPQDHTRDYDRVISILEMSLDMELQLTQREFASYVCDEWEWKANFISTASNYAATKYLGNG